jgi:ABC-type uncharacterized transport systems, ATPase components
VEYLLEMNGITKRFGDLVANDNVTVKVREGSIHSIVGENGAGKSTLMNMLYGLIKPDEGDILLRGKKMVFSSSLDSIAAGLGMIHQHFMLIPVMTVLDNIILGYEIGTIKLNRKMSSEQLLPLLRSFGVSEDVLDLRLGELPVGIQQKIEIMKAIYRKASIIVFDEPTAVLTPKEIEDFFVLVKQLRSEGKTIIFISHKLSEIMEISDEITIMRTGRVVDCVNKTDVNEKILANLMIGRELSEQKVKFCHNENEPVIEAKDIETEEKLGSVSLKKLSFEVRKGEIFGIVGIAGNGQTELVNALVGTIAPTKGQVLVQGNDVTHLPPYKRTLSMAYIPEDRQTDGLVMRQSVTKNLLLGKVDLPRFRKNGIFVNYKNAIQNAKDAVNDYSIKIGNDIDDPVLTLSGGNQQKVIVARELTDDPTIILAVNPTRGIDIGSIEYIHSCLLKERDKGNTILLITNELSEVMALSDRIAVIHNGKVTKVMDNSGVTKEEIGYYMLAGENARQWEEAVME